ncbi:MAG TPA: hypothetical protein VML96_01125, partial [Egibacteraceae bacterium]|nr:hypothetical protein [Egibacteraceae bacterium]
MVPLAPRGRGRAILWGQRVLAIPSGALLVLALPPVSAWWLGFIGAAPALVIWRSARSGRDAAVRGAFAGAGFFGLVYHWLIRHVGVFSLPMAFALGLLWAPLGWIAWRALRPPLSPARAAAALAVVPSAWVAVEFIRSWDRLAGPWGVLGASQWQVQPVLALASLGGVWALSFLLALTSTAATIAAAPDSPRLARGGALAVAALALGGAVTYGAARIPPPTVGELRVTAVQPGLIADPQERFAWQLQQTRDAAGEGTDLIVWGQRSVPYDIQAHPQIQAEIAAAARAAGAPLLVQSDILGDDGYRRAALLVAPDGV